MNETSSCYACGSQQEEAVHSSEELCSPASSLPIKEQQNNPESGEAAMFTLTTDTFLLLAPQAHIIE